MNSKIIGALVGFIGVIAVGGLVFMQKTAKTDLDNTKMANEPETEVSDINFKKDKINDFITPIDHVAEHNSRESCWTIINDSVYDLTSWIPNHPGGEEAILQLCGIDGSIKFNEKHGGSSKQEMILSGFKLDSFQ